MIDGREKAIIWRRTVVVVAVTIAVALPAGVLRALCLGRACESVEAASGSIPFCSLPDDLRSKLAAGYYDGRSGDVFGVANEPLVTGGVQWPSTQSTDSKVGIAFLGSGIDENAAVPDRTTLDSVAPTVAEIIGISRPHPDVRSGEPVAGVAEGDPPRLVLQVVLKNAGAPPNGFLARIFEDGAATLEADTGSLPADPAAAIATIGTGGLPREHGITGALIRNEAGRLVRSWGPGAPPSVIATLADDLDEFTRGRARIGLVADAVSDRGLIGGDWYIDGDRDDFVLAPREAREPAFRILRSGYGDDVAPDLLGIVVDSDTPAVDDLVKDVYTRARRIAGSVALVVTTTGAAVEPTTILSERDLRRAIGSSIGAPVAEGAVAGSLFLDQRGLAERSISEEDVVRAMRSLDWRGRRTFIDAFPGISVSFERYCR